MVRQRSGWAVVFAGFAAGLYIVQAGCHSAPTLTPQEAEGKHLYQVRCAHCHQDNDLGLKKVPPDLHGIAGRFNQEQMAALLAYLHTGLR